MKKSTADTSTQLAGIRTRFGPGCEAVVSTGEGWWPLLYALDQELAKIEPGYQVAQVKEKFGELRYYLFYPDHTRVTCCTKFLLTHPDENDPAWDGHGESAEHRATQAQAISNIGATENRRASMERVIRRFEQLATVTCNECGAPAVGNTVTASTTKCLVHESNQ